MLHFFDYQHVLTFVICFGGTYSSSFVNYHSILCLFFFPVGLFFLIFVFLLAVRELYIVNQHALSV
jgi:hypothetical protein